MPTYLLLNNATASLVTVKPQALFTKKVKTPHFILSRRRVSFDFHQILHGDRGGLC